MKDIKMLKINNRIHGSQKSHFFHFQRWNHSIKVKYIAEAISIFFIWISLFITISNALYMHVDFNNLQASYLSYTNQLTNTSLTSFQIASLKSSQQQVWNSILEKSKENTMYINNSWIIWLFTVPFLFKDIQQIIYAALRYKTLSFTSKFPLFSILNTVIWLELVFSFYFDYTKVASIEDPDYYYKVFQATHYKSNYWSLQHSIGFILVFQFTRVFFILAATRTFGPMVYIILSMIVKVSIFAVIELGVLLIFFCFGRLCFYMLPQFDSEIHAFSTLISISLGNFDLTIFDDPSIFFSKFYGYGYTILFIWISTITLLNFLIAILTHVYDHKSLIEVGLYLQNIIKVRKVLESNPKYSSIVSMVPPLNIITFIFTPFIIWFGSK